MKQHQIVFENLKEFLKEKLNNDLKEEDDGNSISIDKSEFWSSCYESELIIGLGMIHSITVKIMKMLIKRLKT